MGEPFGPAPGRMPRRPVPCVSAAAPDCQDGHPEYDSKRLVAEQRPDGILHIRPKEGHPLRGANGDQALQAVDWRSQQAFDIGYQPMRIGGGNVHKLQGDSCNNGTRWQQRPIAEHLAEPAPARHKAVWPLLDHDHHQGQQEQCPGGPRERCTEDDDECGAQEPVRAVSTTLRQPDSAFTVATPRW